MKAASAPLRKVKLGPADVLLERNADGTIVLRSPHKLGTYPQKLTERLEHWAKAAPDRIHLAQRAADGSWRRLTYAQTLSQVRAIAQSLVQRRLSDGRPIAILGNYALHYVGGVGAGHIRADYFPVWGNTLLRFAGLSGAGTLTMMSNACSGNINGVDVNGHRMSYPPYRKMEQVCDALAAESLRVWKEIQFEKWVELKGSIEEIELGVRHPSAEDLVEAKRRVGENPGNQFKQIEDIYARESVILAREYPKSVKVWNQGLRIGSLGIGTFPGEAFCELGLEVKRRSPFQTTMLIELANGYHGYIPAVEGHAHGGYETWRAKSSHLEVEAAPKMVAAVMRRLESIA